MTPLGKGLASLIPRRGRDDAENILEQIDSMEEVGNEAPENVRRYRSEMEGAQEPQARRLSIAEEDDSPVEDVNEDLEIASDDEEDVFEAGEEPEESDEQGSDEEAETEEAEREGLAKDDDEVIIPKRPLVTPLTPDADPEEEDQILVNEEQGELKDDTEEEAEDEADKEKDTEDDEESIEDDEEDSGEESDEEDDPEVEEEPEIEDEPEVEEEEKPVVQAKDAPIAANERILGENVEYIPLGDIDVNPLQPRRSFDVDDLEELVQSLEQHGMLQPIVVTPRADGKGYQLVAGERRFRASKQLKWDRIPAVVRKNVSGDRNRLELALIENVQRQNLNPIEEAMGYLRLNEEYGMTHEEIGQRVGRSRVGITNIIRILQLPAEIQKGLIEGKIAIGHARAILMIPDEEKQLRFYQHVVDEGLTVRKTENRARRIQRNMNLSDPMRQKMRNRPALGIKYDGMLQDRFGCNVRVKFDNTKNRFEVVFYAYSEDEAVDIVKMLSGEKPLPQALDADVMED